MWLTNISALLVDQVPQRMVATAFGVVAAGSTVGGVVMNQTVGRLVSEHSYTTWFLIAACLHPLGWLILRLGRVDRERSAP
jgi:ACS family hexuronate transporter-like MFS transporter